MTGRVIHICGHEEHEAWRAHGMTSNNSGTWGVARSGRESRADTKVLESWGFVHVIL